MLEGATGAYKEERGVLEGVVGPYKEEGGVLEGVRGERESGIWWVHFIVPSVWFKGDASFLFFSSFHSSAVKNG